MFSCFDVVFFDEFICGFDYVMKIELIRIVKGIVVGVIGDLVVVLLVIYDVEFVVIIMDCIIVMVIGYIVVDGFICLVCIFLFGFSL